MYRKTFVTSFFLQLLIYSILSCEISNRFRCTSNCDGYYICTNGIDVTYKCPQGQHCDMIERNCSSEISSCGPEGYQFKCSSEGIYPDPYDCTKFYICGPAPPLHTLYDPEPVEGGTDLKHPCLDGFAYNPGSTVCDLDLTDDVCKYGPVPKCEVLQQTDSLIRNQSIFYICIEYGNHGLIPQLFRCDSGYYNSTICNCSNSNLNLEKYSVYPCSVNDTQTTTYSSDVTEQSTDYTTEIVSSTEQQTTTDTTIIAPSTSISSTATTDNDSTTDVDSTTNEKTTTESTISISPTEETTSTLSPTTTTISATETEITTSVPPGEFICSRPGVFPDPYDCCSFYICNVHLDKFHYSCDDGFYFNPSTSECEVADKCFPLPPQPTEIVQTTEETHAPFQCDKPGIYPDYYDCHAFYLCTVTGHKFHEYCSDGFHFDSGREDCILGHDCPDVIC